MSFRGKEWMPPDREQVIAEIKNRLSLTELTPDMLEPIFKGALADGDLYTRDEVAEQVHDATYQAITDRRASNKSYYNNIKNLISKDPADAVNIVIPVYNSIHLVKECIDKVLQNTYWPYRLTIVDDASDSQTNKELEKIASQFKNVTFITNSVNRGFAATANRGINVELTRCKYTCLLNSDVLVTPYWLTKMVIALNSNPRNKIVNPVTNNTALINVNMAAGYTYENMNKALELASNRIYPEIMPTGFCFLFPNSLVQTIGTLDESYKNFGEETDFWMRTVTWSNGKTFDRWRAVLADDVYVFHQRGASYATLGEELHMNYRKTASNKFKAAWPSWPVWNKTINANKAVGVVKQLFRQNLLAEIKQTEHKVQTPICYVVHSAEPCGGMHFIADIINAINENGGDARIAVIRRGPEKAIDPVAELRCAPYFFKDSTEFIETFSEKVFNKGIVVAATAELAPYVADLVKTNENLKSVLHVQSYEPALTLDPALASQLKQNFDLIPNIVSSSNWITKNLPSQSVIATVNPGVDQDIFYPGKRRGDDRPTILFALNGNYPFKGANRGIDVILELKKLSQKYGKEIRIMAYGCDAVPGVTSVLCQGITSRTRIAELLRTEADLFIDPALNHSYGMPALEAIACGVPVVGWDNLGIREYLPKSPSIMSATTSASEVAELAFKLLTDESARNNLKKQQQATVDLTKHNRHTAAIKTIDALFNVSKKKNTPLKITVVTPHLRKHGGPTTILTMADELRKRGHQVTLATVYSDINPEVLTYGDLPVTLLHQNSNNLPECDVIITNSDNPLNNSISQFPKAKRKIMLKLSHNARFKELEEFGLNCKWDAIVTSTQWIADVCENVTPGWNYSPVKATRIGWFHYNFERMRRNPKRKVYNTLESGRPIVISTLIHAHPSKGSQEAGKIMTDIYRAFGRRVHLYGVGEIPPQDVRTEIPMEYIASPSREDMADLMFKTDIWLGCSHTEGLGRMALEAMTGSAACVLTDTGAEYVEEGYNAKLAPVGDVDTLTKHVHELILNVEERKQLAVNGYQTAKEMADPTDFIDRLEEVIYGVL